MRNSSPRKAFVSNILVFHQASDYFVNIFLSFVKHELKGVLKYRGRKFGPTTQPVTDIF